MSNTGSSNVKVSGIGANGKPYTANVTVKITSNAPKVENNVAAQAAAQAAAPVVEEVAAAAPPASAAAPVAPVANVVPAANLNAKAKAADMAAQMGLTPSTGGRRKRTMRKHKRQNKRKQTRQNKRKQRK